MTNSLAIVEQALHIGYTLSVLITQPDTILLYGHKLTGVLRQRTRLEEVHDPLDGGFSPVHLPVSPHKELSLSSSHVDRSSSVSFCKVPAVLLPPILYPSTRTCGARGRF